MYDKYIIVEKDFKNVGTGDKVTGFQVKARLPYYRGLMLSMVEDIRLLINEELIPAHKLKLTLNGRTYTLPELEHVYGDRWEFGEPGIITVERPGGLPAGDYNIELTLAMRISYRPVLLTGKDRKTLEIDQENIHTA